MKRFGHIFLIILVLFCIGAAESTTYTVQEIAGTERADDFRESDELRLSANSIKVSKAAFEAVRKAPQEANVKCAVSIFRPAQSLPQFLYLRFRALRN